MQQRTFEPLEILRLLRDRISHEIGAAPYLKDVGIRVKATVAGGPGLHEEVPSIVIHYEIPEPRA